MTPSSEPIRVAVTGGPGAGKTTLLEGLKQRGYAVVPEVARQIIADRKASGQSPRPEPLEFAQLIFQRDTEQYLSMPATNELIFFDRSIVDSLGMLAGLDKVCDTRREEILQQYPYHPTALILPPWRAIYRQDSERDQSYDDSVRVYESLRRWYTRCGYSLLEVPHGAIDDRCEFVLRNIK